MMKINSHLNRYLSLAGSNVGAHTTIIVELFQSALFFAIPSLSSSNVSA
jgi:hypothetical protein